MKDIFKIQNYGFSNMISSYEKERISSFLNIKLFPKDFYENCFPKEAIIYRKNFENEWSVIESLIHNKTKAAAFTPLELNNSILISCKKFNINEGCYWFNVNVHDNVARIIEEVGPYRLEGQNPRLAPLYERLTSNQAKEGGTSYTGLIGRDLDWCLIMEFDAEISIKIAGPNKFCDFMEQDLKTTANNTYK